MNQERFGDLNSELNSDFNDDPDIVQRARDVVGSASDNPMLMLLGGLAIGFLIGMLLPMSRFERDRLGPVADDLKGRAREAIKDSIGAAAEAARA